MRNQVCVNYGSQQQIEATRLSLLISIRPYEGKALVGYSLRHQHWQQR